MLGSIFKFGDNGILGPTVIWGLGLSYKMYGLILKKLNI